MVKCTFFLISLVLVNSLLMPQVPSIEDLEKKLATASPREKLSIINQICHISRFNFIWPPSKILDLANEELRLARSLNDPREEGQAKCNLAYGYFKKGDSQTALDFYYQAREIFMKIHNENNVAYTDFEIGNLFHFVFNDFNTTLNYYGKSLEIYRRIGDAYGQVSNLNNMAEIYKKTGRFDTAAKYYIDALNICEANPAIPRVRMGIAPLLANLSDIYLMLGDTIRSSEYLDRARTIFENSNRPWGVAGIMARHGDWFKKEKKYDQALTFYSSALSIWEKLGKENYPQEYASQLHNIGETYSLNHDFARAFEYFHRALEIRRASNHIQGIAQTLLAMGLTYWRQGEEQKALILLGESMDICKKHEFDNDLLEIYLQLSDLHSRRGNLQQSLYFRKQYDEIKEKTQGVRVIADISKIMLKYEKDREIIHIRKGRSLIVAIYIASSILLLAIMMILLLNLKRIKLWAGRVLSVKDRQLEEKESQLETLRSKLKELENPPPAAKYVKSSLTDERAKECLRRLIEIMDKDRPYLDSECTLNSLADKLDINRSYLSQVINKHMGRNFYDFINRFRVDEAKRLLSASDKNRLSVLDIAFDVGFNSKSSFYNIFKKLTGLTPAEFARKKNKTQIFEKKILNH